MDFIFRLAEEFLKKHKMLNRYRRVFAVIAAVVVFATTYELILPAITMDRMRAAETPGIEVGVAADAAEEEVSTDAKAASEEEEKADKSDSEKTDKDKSKEEAAAKEEKDEAKEESGSKAVKEDKEESVAKEEHKDKEEKKAGSKEEKDSAKEDSSGDSAASDNGEKSAQKEEQKEKSEDKDHADDNKDDDSSSDQKDAEKDDPEVKDQDPEDSEKKDDDSKEKEDEKTDSVNDAENDKDRNDEEDHDNKDAENRDDEDKENGSGENSGEGRTDNSSTGESGSEPGTNNDGESENKDDAVTGSTMETAADASTETLEDPAAAATAEIADPLTPVITYPAAIVFEGKDYTITATFDEKAKLPADVKLDVVEILPGVVYKDENGDPLYPTYEEYLEKTLKALEKEKRLEDDRTVANARFFDITFVDGEGRTVEPAAPVNIAVKYKEALSAVDTKDTMAVHFEEKQDEKEKDEFKVKVTDVIDTQTEVKKKEIKEISFEAEKFSVYGILGIEIIEKTVLASDGHNYRITVTCGPEAGVPEDADLEVTEITEDAEAYGEYVARTEQALGWDEGSAGYIRLFDIKIVDKDRQKVEIAAPVSVEIKLDDKEDSETTQVVHFADEGEDGNIVDGVKVDGESISFETEGFSVYAVVDEPIIADESRMTLYFHDVDDNVISTIYVKNADSADELKKIIFDPGDGKQSDNELFKGWIMSEVNSETKPSYSSENADDAMDIQAIRDWAESRSITEGDFVHIYPMVFKTFSVTFKDEDGVTMKGEALIFATNEDSVTYTINTPYTPKSQDAEFQGWYYTSPNKTDENPTVVANDGSTEPFENETVVQISDNIVFWPTVPDGYWLSFSENGKGASYTPPQFIPAPPENSTFTTKPTDPTRKGYRFTGWNTKADGSGETWLTVTYSNNGTPSYSNSRFGGKLTGRTDLYAQWEEEARATYSVIIWKQRVSDDKNAADADKTYDVGEVLTLSGTVGSTINVVTQPNNNTNVNTGRGNSVRNYSVNGSQKSYLGFYAARYDQNVTIKAEGTTVLNVYYDRQLITMTFDAGNNRYIYNENTNTYTRTATYSGLFDSPLSFTWPAYYYTNSNGGGESRAGWYNADLSNLSFYDSFKLYNTSRVSETINRKDPTDYPVRFYKQNEDGTWPTSPTNTAYMSGRNFNISDKYTGFFAYQYRTNNSSTSTTGWSQWTNARNNNWTENNPSYKSVSSYGQLDIRFERRKYTITFLDGTYFNGNDVVLQEATSTPLDESDLIYYEASTASYNKGQPNYYTPTAPAGYTFGGWYVDPTCTVPYTFTTMPAGGITVYAKWVQTQYRVFLHPNVPTSDTSLEWGQTNQQMSFRVDHGDKLNGGSTLGGTRSDYELIGWYTDPACTHAFNFGAYTLNDTTVTTPYDQTENTELDKYGNVLPGQAGVNSDADSERFWITRKLDLYAKWRAKLEGAEGIHVEYDAVQGEGAFADEEIFHTDPILYLDSAEAVAGSASVAADQENKQFLHWVVQRWDGTEYVDTDKTVYPGDTFDVLKSEAKLEPITDGSQTATVYNRYTVRLRAAYGPKEAATETHIDWYPNFGDNFAVHQDEGLQINEPVNIFQKQSREGYKFLGWARIPETQSNTHMVEGHDTPQGAVLELTKDDLYLTYHEEDGGYFTAVINETEKRVSKVAADEVTPYHDMYAVWQKAYKVTVKKAVVSGISADHNIDFEFTPFKNINGTPEQGEAFTLKDTESKVVYGDLLEDDHFSVQETANNDFNITVTGKYKDDEGTWIEIANLGNGTDITIQGDTEITVTNTRKPKRIKIYKTDNSDTPVALEGVEFTIDGKTLSTGENGYTQEFSLVPSDTPYPLTESKSIDHYEGLSSAVPVSVNGEAVGAVTVPSGTENVTVSGPVSDVYTITVVNPRKKYTVTAIKEVVGTEADQAAQYGFTSTGLTTSTGSDSFTVRGSDDSGTDARDNEKTYENIIYNTEFSITESAEVLDTFRLEVTGKYTDDAGNEHEIENLTNGGHITLQGNTVITFKNTRKVTDVIVKKELVNPYMTGSDGQDFSFTASWGDTADEQTEFTVNSNSQTGYTIPNVPVGGTMVIAEAADTAYEYTVTPTGQNTTDTDQTANTYTFKIPITGETVTFKNEVIKASGINVIKTDDKTPATGLKGAVFTLSRNDKLDGTGTYEVVNGLYSDGITSGEGGVMIASADSLPTGYYKLIETHAPDGHIFTEGEILFRVFHNESNEAAVSLVNSPANASVSQDGKTLTITNTAGQVLPFTGSTGRKPHALGGIFFAGISALMFVLWTGRRERRLK